jgi:hypothetical protein
MAVRTMAKVFDSAHFAGGAAFAQSPAGAHAKVQGGTHDEVRP